MPIEFDTENSTQSEAYLASSASCVCPSSNTGDLILLTIQYFQNNGLSTTLNTPTINGVNMDFVAASTNVATYSFPGGAIGEAHFTFSTNPASMRSFFVRMTGQKTVSPFSAGYSAINSGIGHIINAGIAAPYDGAVLFGAIVATAFPGDIEVGVGFDSVNAIFDADEDFNYNQSAGTVAIIMPLNVAIQYAENAGDGGSLSWTSNSWNLFTNYGVNASILAFWISPLQAPSAPTVLTPRQNDKFTVGSTQAITYNPATDPNIDTDDLVYKIYYSDNQGITYSLLTTTAAGVLSYNWNTAGLAAGHYRIKVIANNGTDDGEAGYSGDFQLFADVAPGAPTNLYPTGYISQAAIDFTWVGNYPDFDSQKAYELRYSSNADMGSPTSTGKVTSTAALKAWSASSGILASTGQKYWDVATYGLVDDTLGTRSQATPVFVATAPATPTITSSSTANTAFWTFTFTAIAHFKFKVRLVLGGNSRLNAEVTSSAFSFTTPIRFGTGEVWDVYISVFDPTTGLQSAEAHQTLTVTYTGPAKPGLDLTVLGDGIQISVTNSDTIDHTRILRSVAGANDYIVISPKLGQSATFIDRQVRGDLGDGSIEYDYIARSFKPTTLGFTDSDPDTASIILSALEIHVADKVSTTSNAGLKVSILIEGDITKKFIKNHVSRPMQGRDKHITFAGQTKYTELTYNCFIAVNDTETFPALKAVFDSSSTLCIRDTATNKIFGRITGLPKESDLASLRFTLTCTEEYRREEFTR